ncbi:hypothetical protein ABZX62_26895 [Streptomyces flavidovirens]|uniref:hypothetical protein n=1 Tax=Streptomyces flavidovirens TaxID=67298 RepID=UPI0033AB1951
MQISGGGDLRDVAQPATDPVQRVAEDPDVVQTLGLVELSERLDVPALQLFKSDDSKCVTQQVGVSPLGDARLLAPLVGVGEQVSQVDTVIGMPLSPSQNRAGSRPSSVSTRSR